jgi:hypothetical protein
MQAQTASYVCSVLLASHSAACGLTATQWRWRRLAVPLSAAYRPELHYMRGPGPKWREKHAAGARKRQG